MRHTGSTDWVVRAYSENPSEEFWNGKRSVFSADGVLYSYGRHFPLAVALPEGRSGARFLLNGDRYSVTTNGHQGATFGVFREEPRVSFRAVGAALGKHLKGGGFDLPGDTGSNLHRATRGAAIGGAYLVSGRVRHVEPRTGRGTREHRTVRLREARFWRAVRNLALGAWSGGGKVD